MESDVTMQVTIQGKQIELGDALRTHVTEKLEEINQKYFNHATFASVTFSKEGHGHGQIRAVILIKVGKNIEIAAEALSGEAYASFDGAATKVAKQMRRYKNRLRDHHERLEKAPAADFSMARDTVFNTDSYDEEAASGDEPLVIAEMTKGIQTMSVSEAVMRLDLISDPALMFRNAHHNEINMVYRRADGNIGWIDPVSSIAGAQHIKAVQSRRA